MKPITRPNDTEIPCACCLRQHRKLYLVGGFWLGRNCAETYQVYRDHPEPTAFVWQGYEAQYARVRKMATGQ